MGNNKEVEERILCLPVWRNRIWLGRGTNNKPGEKGLFTGPGGFVLRGFSPSDEIARYCNSDMKLGVKSYRKVAEASFNVQGASCNVLLSVFEVEETGLFPVDTDRIKEIQSFFLDKLPLNEMPLWGAHVPAMLRSQKPLSFNFVLENSHQVLSTVNTVAEQFHPA